MAVGEHMRRPLSETDPLPSFRNHKVDPTLGVLQAELHTDLQLLPLGHQALLHGLTGDLDVQFSSIPVWVCQVAAADVILRESVQISFLIFRLRHLEGGVEVLEGRLDRLIETDSVDSQLLGIQSNVLQIVSGWDQCQLNITEMSRSIIQE